MLKEALQYLIDLGNTRIEEVNGRKYSTQQIYPVKQPTSACLEVTSLSGLVEYLKSHFDGTETLMVQVESPTVVWAFGALNIDKNRNHLIKAEALLPHFQFDRFYNTEDFNIKLQSCFISNDYRETVLKVVGNIKEEQVANFGDDGVSQSVTAKTGVATVGNVKVPNPVALKPYRTFVEVDQPESNFVFRMQNGPGCALFEADGGGWKLKAMQNISLYLQEALQEELEAGKLFIIA